MLLNNDDHRRDPVAGLLEDVLATESASGRLEGAFLGDPELGRMWRAQMALSETCRSVALEDIHLFEGDLVLRPFETRNTAFETARGAQHGTELLKVLSAPGDILSDPVATITRCMRAGSARDHAVDGAGDEWPDLDALAQQITAEIAAAPGPTMAAIRAAAHLRAVTGSQLPAAERLLFTCVDHACRAPHLRGAATDGADEVAPLLAQLRAGWVLLPAMAMTAQGFRAWSPSSPRGIRDLLAGLRIETGRALGQLPVLRRWRDRARQVAADKPGKSHLDDLVTLAIHQPILTGRAIAETHGVTDRTARNLVDTAVDAGLFAPITGRRSYRAWAPLPMAERLRMRSTRGDRTPPVRADPVAAAVPDAGEPRAMRTGGRVGPREAEALAELDEALARADQLLAKYRVPDR